MKKPNEIFENIQRQIRHWPWSLVTVGLWSSCFIFVCGCVNFPKELGYRPDDKLLIINADDFGAYHAVNVGTLKALKYGLVKSATLIVPAPEFQEAVQMVKENPELDIGIHLTLHCEYDKVKWGPVLSVKEVPSLVGKDGYFYPNEGDIKRVNKDEAIREFRAQIKCAIDAGIRPTHLDCHMGCYERRFDIFQEVVRLAAEYELPMRNAVSERKVLLRCAGVLSNDRFTMFYDVEESRRKQIYFNYFQGLKPGINELAVHVLDAEQPQIDTPSDHERRANELRIFTSPETKEWLKQLDIRLIGYRELQEIQKKIKEKNDGL